MAGKNSRSTTQASDKSTFVDPAAVGSVVNNYKQLLNKFDLECPKASDSPMFSMLEELSFMTTNVKRFDDNVTNIKDCLKEIINSVEIYNNAADESDRKLEEEMPGEELDEPGTQAPDDEGVKPPMFGIGGQKSTPVDPNEGGLDTEGIKTERPEGTEIPDEIIIEGGKITRMPNNPEGQGVKPEGQGNGRQITPQEIENILRQHGGGSSGGSGTGTEDGTGNGTRITPEEFENILRQQGGTSGVSEIGKTSEVAAQGLGNISNQGNDTSTASASDDPYKTKDPIMGVAFTEAHPEGVVIDYRNQDGNSQSGEIDYRYPPESGHGVLVQDQNDSSQEGNSGYFVPQQEKFTETPTPNNSSEEFGI